VFSNSLIQAINDWQRGGDPGQKARRGKKLKAECASLPVEFRQTALCCFRQIALMPKYVWALHDQLRLKETISSWTLTTDVAQQFKGGVPPDRIPGLILDIVPPPDSVIVNLDALFRNEEFVRACSDASSRITAYGDGIGRYGNTQHEVVLEIASVPITAVYALGGHSSSQNELANFYFGREPSAAEFTEFEQLLKLSGTKLGPMWLVGAAKDRVLGRTLKAHGLIKARYIREGRRLPDVDAV
jgi:hypothetical protein